MCSTNTGITRYTTIYGHYTLALENKTSAYHIRTIPVDAEVVSVISQATERV